MGQFEVFVQGMLVIAWFFTSNVILRRTKRTKHRKTITGRGTFRVAINMALLTIVVIGCWYFYNQTVIGAVLMCMTIVVLWEIPTYMFLHRDQPWPIKTAWRTLGYLATAWAVYGMVAYLLFA